MQLVLRSINSSRSAYAAVIFHQQNQRFFSAYDTFGNQVVQAGIVLKVRTCTEQAGLQTRAGLTRLLCSKPWRCSGRTA